MKERERRARATVSDYKQSVARGGSLLDAGNSSYSEPTATARCIYVRIHDVGANRCDAIIHKFIGSLRGCYRIVFPRVEVTNWIGLFTDAADWRAARFPNLSTQLIEWNCYV